MLDFMNMADNYEERLVENYTKGGLQVDTCAITDSDQPFETGILHPKYNNGNWVIVQMYDTKEEARTGHALWVKLMTAKKLPNKLEDVSTCEIAKLINFLEN